MVVVAPFAHASNHIFNEHNGAIDNESEIDSTQAHQVAGKAGDSHAYESAQHGEWHSECDNDTGPEATEQEKKDQDDEHAALDEIFSEGADSFAHEFGAVVEDAEFHALRQGFGDFVNALLDGLNHSAGVGPG